MTSSYDNEVLKGTKIEEEHRKTFDWLVQCFRDGVAPSFNALCYHIAMDHVSETKDYYERLEKAGL